MSSARKENISFSEEIDKLRSEILNLGNYKDELDAKNEKEISVYKEEISALKNSIKKLKRALMINYLMKTVKQFQI